MDRPDLTKIEDTLAVFHMPRAGYRRVYVEADGTIVYPDRTEDDPPRTPNGYERDPNDSHRFLPLWPMCLTRHGTGFWWTLCGCIDIILRCGNPKAAKFVDRVKWEECRDCPVRVTGKADASSSPPCPPDSSSA